MTILPRSRSFLIRLGVGLVAVGSLVAVVVLLTHVPQTPTSFHAGSAGTPQADPDSSAANAAPLSTVDKTAAARAQAQMDSLRTDAASEWAVALILDSTFTNDAGLPPMTVEDIEPLELIAGINPWAADWLPSGIGETLLMRPDVTASGTGGFAFGSGTSRGASGGSGGAVGGSVPSSGSSMPNMGSAAPAGLSDAGLSFHTPGEQQRGGDEGRPSGPPAHNNGENHRPAGSGGGNGTWTSSVTPGEDSAPSSRELVSVPEPSSMVLLGLGLASLTATRLRRRAGR